MYNGIFSHKRNEMLRHVPTWVNLEGIMLREISQSQKAKLCIIPFICNIYNRQIHRDSK